MALELCNGLISQSVAPDCDNIITNGLEQIGVIFNRSEIEMTKGLSLDSVTYDNIVSAVNAASGTGSATGYAIYQLGSQPFNGTKVEFAEGTAVNTFTNTCSFVLLDNGPQVCKNVIDQLSNGEFVVIFQNKFTSATGTGNTAVHLNKYQMMGVERGLKASGIECDKYSDDTNSGWAITLTEEKATKSAWFFNTGTDSGTKSAFDGFYE